LKLFIDECLSPRLAARLNASGEHEAMHPRDYGRLGERDDQVLARCLEESRTIVTENAVDFRKLIAAEEIHPGLIILPSTSRSESERLLDKVLAKLASLGDPPSVMINKVIEISAEGEFVIYDLPEL
jgi:predicted nuclease of predicted toxin-antitoxin system